MKKSYITPEQKEAAMVHARAEFDRIEKEREASGEFETVGAFGLYVKEDIDFGNTPSVVNTSKATTEERAAVTEEQIDAAALEISTVPLAENDPFADLPYSQEQLQRMCFRSNEYSPSDVGNAERLAMLFGDKLRYVAERKKWYMYNGKYWKACNNGESESAMLATVHAIKDEIELCKVRARGTDEKSPAAYHLKSILAHYRASNQSKSIGNALKIASMMPAFKTTYLTIDSPASAYMLNTEEGTIDLTTGVLRAFKLEDYIGRTTGVRVGDTSECPKFKALLDGVFLGDQALIDYFLLIIGASLLGTRKKSQEFYLFQGIDGSNGKTTLMNTVANALGSYIVKSDAYTWIDTGNHNASGTSEDIADLDNGRLILVAELPKEKMFNEHLIKSWTGGDDIKARRNYESNIKVRSTGTLILSTNHEPKIDARDNSMWRRNKSLPFLARFANDSSNMEEGKVDANEALEEELMSELPGILRLFIDSCLTYQQVGLKNVPDAVKKCIETSKAKRDTIGQFVAECCTKVDVSRVTKTSDAYATYKHWAAEQGHNNVTIRKNFVDSMKRLGFPEGEKSKYNNQNVMPGLRVDFSL